MGKKAVQMEIKSDGALFFDLFLYRSMDIPHMTPLLHACELIEGEWGKVGCVLVWHNVHDGKITLDTETLTGMDKEKKLLEFKYIDGGLMELYKSLNVTVQFDKRGEKNVVTWAVGYEKLNDGIPDGDFILEMFLNITKQIDQVLSKNIEEIP